jgi:hypothetical protein
MQEKNCSKCNHPMEYYCIHCGQQDRGRKTTLLSVCSDFVSFIYSFERSLPGTVWTILRDPQLVVSDYMNGYRNYFKTPANLYIISVLLIGLLNYISPTSYILGITIEGEIQGMGKDLIFWLFIMSFLFLSSLLYFSFLKKGLLHQLISLFYISTTFTILFLLGTIGWVLVFGPLQKTNMLVFFILLVGFWHARAMTFSQRLSVLFINFIAMVIVMFFWGSMLLLLSNFMNGN